MTRVLSATFAVVVLLGVSLGALWPVAPDAGPGSAGASHIDVTLRVNPGANITLFCSWHGTCGSTAGTALDWDHFADHGVYWRSHGYRSDTPYSFSIATGTIERYTSGNCYEVRVHVVDAYSFAKGYIRYLHVETIFDTWPIDVRGSSGWTYESYIIAWTVEEGQDKANCPHDGEHLHQDGTSGFTSTRNSLYDSLGSYWVGLLQNWQYSQSWSW